MASPKAALRYCPATWWQKKNELENLGLFGGGLPKVIAVPELWAKEKGIIISRSYEWKSIICSTYSSSMFDGSDWVLVGNCRITELPSAVQRMRKVMVWGDTEAFPTTNRRKAVMSPGKKMVKFNLVKSLCTWHLFPILTSECKYCNFFREGESVAFKCSFLIEAAETRHGVGLREGNKDD